MRGFVGLALMLAVAGAQTPPAFAAATSVPLPFDQNESVRIIQGYNGGTHQGASIYGLDLVLDGDETSGAPVLAPFDGTVPWAFEPGEKTGCIEVLARDRQFGLMMCHVMLDRPFEHGEKVVRGEQLGTVGAPGMVGNNGVAHVHIELHQHGHSNEIVPFSAADGGLALEGWDLPATGDVNEHAGEGPITSSTPPMFAAPAPSTQ